MDEFQESTEKVEEIGELQEVLGLHQVMDQLLEALCGRPVARHTSSSAGKPRRRAADLVDPFWDSTLLQEAVRLKVPTGGAVVRWRPEGFGFVKVDGADVLAAGSWSSWRSTWPRAVKYRAATDLHREQDYEEVLAKTRAEEAAEAAVRAAGEANLAQLRAQWNRPPGLLTTKMVDMGVQTSLVSFLSIEASRLVQQVVETKNV